MLLSTVNLSWLIRKDVSYIYIFVSQEEDLIGPGYARSLQRFVVVLSSSFFLLTEGKAENFTFIFVTFFNAGTLWQYNTKGAIIGKLSKGKGFVFVLLQVITFIDLAGHERYLKTTIFGMTGHVPDFAMLMVRCHIDVQ